MACIHFYLVLLFIFLRTTLDPACAFHHIDSISFLLAAMGGTARGGWRMRILRWGGGFGWMGWWMGRMGWWIWMMGWWIGWMGWWILDRWAKLAYGLNAGWGFRERRVPAEEDVHHGWAGDG